MPRKTTILIVILAIITGVLIFLAIRSDQTFNAVNTDQDQQVTDIPIQEAFANLYFSQPRTNVDTSVSSMSVDIILDSGGQNVAGAQVELSYDSSVISNVTLSSPQSSLFGDNASILISAVDPDQGRISYAIGVNAQGQEVAGVGPIVTLTFDVIGGPNADTQMLFLPKSAVTTFSSQGSVLKESTPLRIFPSSPETGN